jgi:hypothetical protein
MSLAFLEHRNPILDLPVADKFLLVSRQPNVDAGVWRYQQDSIPKSELSKRYGGFEMDGVPMGRR